MNPEFLALSIIILLFSVIVHEVMHGLVALKFGDHTAEHAGRLTLNPIPHIDPVGSILLPLLLFVLPLITGSGSGFFIAWAKPVPVNPLNFSNIRRGELLVSAAGILSNFTMAILATILFHILLPNLGFHNLFIQLLAFITSLNLLLGLFNLLPIPPLDGSKILMSQLSYNAARQFEKIAPYGIFILLFLIWVTPFFGIILNIFLGYYSRFFDIPICTLNCPSLFSRI